MSREDLINYLNIQKDCFIDSKWDYEISGDYIYVRNGLDYVRINEEGDGWYARYNGICETVPDSVLLEIIDEVIIN